MSRWSRTGGFSEHIWQPVLCGLKNGEVIYVKMAIMNGSLSDLLKSTLLVVGALSIWWHRPRAGGAASE